MIKKSFFDIDYHHLSVLQTLELIDDYASAGADVHEINLNKQNILILITHFAKEHSEQLITKFIKLGANMYFKNIDGDFPLRSCARCGTPMMFKSFLESGFDLNKLSLEEKKEISVAATYNHDPDMLKLIIDLGLYDHSAHQQMVLNRAILLNNDSVVRSMLDSKTDLVHQSFLDEAVFTMNKINKDDPELMEQNHQIIKLLVHAGAKLSDESAVIYRAISNYHLAVNTIKLLKEIGVNWNVLSPIEQKEVEKIF